MIKQQVYSTKALRLSISAPNGKYLSRDCGDAFSISSRHVGTRLDAASFDPSVRKAAELIADSGGAALWRSCSAEVSWTAMSDITSRLLTAVLCFQDVTMLQARPVNLKHISDRSFKDPAKFVLKAGSTIFTCDGRSEEALGEPAYVMPIWDGWMASEHVMRVEPLTVGPGYLYVCPVFTVGSAAVEGPRNWKRHRRSRTGGD